MAAEPKPRPAALRVLLSDKSQRQMVMSAKVNGSTSVPGNLCLVYNTLKIYFWRWVSWKSPRISLYNVKLTRITISCGFENIWPAPAPPESVCVRLYTQRSHTRSCQQYVHWHLAHISCVCLFGCVRMQTSRAERVINVHIPTCLEPLCKSTLHAFLTATYCYMLLLDIVVKMFPLVLQGSQAITKLEK